MSNSRADVTEPPLDTVADAGDPTPLGTGQASWGTYKHKGEQGPGRACGKNEMNFTLREQLSPRLYRPVLSGHLKRGR